MCTQGSAAKRAALLELCLFALWTMVLLQVPAFVVLLFKAACVRRLQASCCVLPGHVPPAGLSPEYVTFTADGLRVGAGFNLLRPEALEAMWYMWRLTRDWRYRTWGWHIFQAFEEHCKVSSRAGCAAGRTPRPLRGRPGTHDECVKGEEDCSVRMIYSSIRPNLATQPAYSCPHANHQFPPTHTPAQTQAGYAGLKDVRVNPPHQDDTMQSFFLAETLKYLWLLFRWAGMCVFARLLVCTCVRPHPAAKFLSADGCNNRRRHASKVGLGSIF